MDAILAGADGLTPALALGLGLAIGLEHAFEPDHVAAMGTQVGREPGAEKSRLQRIRGGIARSSLAGAIWGAGHTTTIVLVGLLAYVAVSIIQDWVFSGLEFIVGVMLLVLGISSILNRRPFRSGHAHHHKHEDGTVHVHEHDHRDGSHRHTHRSYVIGLVHGLAGSGAVVALAAATLEGPGMVMAFLLVFGAGSALGMCMIGGLLGIPLTLVGHRRNMQKLFRYAAGGFSLAIGATIIHQTWTAGLLGA